ncbi:DUF2721 domain-containing protein [Croceibacterium ferulae]|uniref:DUF2721 domain-containing protein n=1 Tax=Croceibacterium ferulae TaxID=1854641 RepID=UPI001F4F0FE7|nr:DUF2721 domain-containing protein [Croceibacterium ferulae]
MEINIDGVIAQTIQLALTPVFVLVAIGNILNILSNRLARVVDRSRILQKSHARTSGLEHDAVVREIRIVDRRIRLINSAMLLLVMSGLSIGITVAMLFVEEVFSASLQNAAAAFFFASIALLMAALLSFLRETRVATNALKIPETYLELERKL